MSSAKPSWAASVAVNQRTSSASSDCARFSGYPAAEEIDEHVVIQSAARVIAQHAVVNAEEFSRFNDQAGFFADFPHGSFAKGLSQLQHAVREWTILPPAEDAHA